MLPDAGGVGAAGAGAAPPAGPATGGLLPPPSYPVDVTGEPDPGLSRWLWLVKWLLAIPHFVILFFLWIAYFAVTVTSAVRFGGVAAIIAVLTIAFSYTAVVYYNNAVTTGHPLTLTNLTDLAMRTGFVAITGIFVGFVGDRARRAERALQEELERAHASLSEVTVELNRDLEFEQTCQLAAQKGRSLLGADAVLLQVQMPALIGQDESTPGRMATNSSPPYRVTVSSRRIVEEIVRAAAFRATSPAA